MKHSSVSLASPAIHVLPHLNPASSPSVKIQTAARRAGKRKRELSDLENGASARTLAPTPNLQPPTTEELLTVKFWGSRTFAKIPRRCLSNSRTAYFRCISLFAPATPDQTGADFTDSSDPACAEQNTAFLRIFIYPQAMLRRLYPVEKGAGGAQAETAALKARLKPI